MSDPRLENDHLNNLDGVVKKIFEEYRALHERTLTALQSRTQNLRGDELWPTDVAGSVAMLQRTYNERRSQLDQQWGEWLAERRKTIEALIAQGENAPLWQNQLDLNDRLNAQPLPGLLEVEFPLLRRDQTFSVAQTREFYNRVVENLLEIRRAFEAIETLWGSRKGRQTMQTIYLIFSRVDALPIAEQVERLLVQAGLTAIRTEPDAMNPDVWEQQASTAIAQADTIVVIYSPALKDSGWAGHELEFAQKARKSIIQLGGNEAFYAWHRMMIRVVVETPAELIATLSPSQHQNAEPPMEEAQPEEVDGKFFDEDDEFLDADEVLLEEEEFDDEESSGGELNQPSAPPPPKPIVVPSQPSTIGKADPEPSKPTGLLDDVIPGGPVPNPRPRETGATKPEKKVERGPQMALPSSRGETDRAIHGPTHFSAYAPKEVSPDTWASLAAYIYRESAFDRMVADAEQKFGAALAEMRHGKAMSLVEIEEGATITATPRLDGFTFNPESLSLKYVKLFHRFDFEMMAGRERLNLASNGAITFSMDGVLIGEIPLSVFISEGAKAVVEPVAATPYQKIFCSYSHRDSKVVERVERAYRVLGFDYLRDVTRLRSGQEWNAELMRWIDEANIFQLFWSSAAAQSPYVEQEWRHALQMSRANFIRPVYWKKPLVAPPAELGKLHFAYDPQIQGVGWWNKLTGLVRG